MIRDKRNKVVVVLSNAVEFFFANVMKATWIVLVNDSRLRVFEMKGGKRMLHEIVDFLSPKGTREIKKYFAAFQLDSVVNRHSACADNNAGDLCDALVQQDNLFSKQISSYIERARQNGCFAKIWIVGSRVFLNLLREDMTENAKCLIEREFIDDAINFEQPILEKYLN